MPRNRSEKITPAHQAALDCLRAVRAFAQALSDDGRPPSGGIGAGAPVSTAAFKLMQAKESRMQVAFGTRLDRTQGTWALVADELEREIEERYAAQSK